MTKIPGVSFQSDAKGKVKKVTFDMKKHERLLEDILDNMEVQALRNQPSDDWETVKKRLNKKHGIKDV